MDDLEILILEELWLRKRFHHYDYSRYLIENKLDYFEKERQRGGFRKTKYGAYLRTINYIKSDTDVAQEKFESTDEFTWNKKFS